MKPPRRRALVVGTRVGGLEPWTVAGAVAAGFAGSLDVAALGLASGGPDLGEVLARLCAGRADALPGGWVAQGPGWTAIGAGPESPSVPLPLTATGTPLGRILAAAIAPAGPDRVIVDLTSGTGLDAGAGLLGGLGAEADVALDGGASALHGAARVRLEPARARLSGADLVGVVPLDEQDDRLLGLRGIAARRGRVGGADPTVMLAVDRALADFARACSPERADAPGAGAGGGAGFAVLALGGRLLTGFQLAAELSGLEATMARADLVVAACRSFDVGNQGGPLVRELAVRAQVAERPLVVLAGEVSMSAREMRAIGVECVYPVAGAAPDLVSGWERAAARAAADWAH